MNRFILHVCVPLTVMTNGYDRCYLKIFLKRTTMWGKWRILYKSNWRSSAILLTGQTFYCQYIPKREIRWWRRRCVRMVIKKLSRILLRKLREMAGPHRSVATSKAMSNRLRDQYWWSTGSLWYNILLYDTRNRFSLLAFHQFVENIRGTWEYINLVLKCKSCFKHDYIYMTKWIN